MTTVRVMIADDNELAREATRTLLSRDPAFEVVAEAVDGNEAIDMAAQFRPDLVLMDLNMPGCDGIVATRLIKRQLPGVIVVMLTVSNDATDLFAAIQSGAQGYLVKSLHPQDWLEYLKTLVGDMTAVPPDMAGRLLSQFDTGASAPLPGSADRVLSAALTEREREVLALVAQAYGDRHIAERLGISLFTVKNHIRNIRAKVGAANRVELALLARRSAGTGAMR